MARAFNDAMVIENAGGGPAGVSHQITPTRDTPGNVSGYTFKRYVANPFPPTIGGAGLVGMTYAEPTLTGAAAGSYAVFDQLLSRGSGTASLHLPPGASATMGIGMAVMPVRPTAATYATFGLADVIAASGVAISGVVGGYYSFTDNNGTTPTTYTCELGDTLLITRSGGSYILSRVRGTTTIAIRDFPASQVVDTPTALPVVVFATTVTVTADTLTIIDDVGDKTPALDSSESLRAGLGGNPVRVKSVYIWGEDLRQTLGFRNATTSTNESSATTLIKSDEALDNAGYAPIVQVHCPSFPLMSRNGYSGVTEPILATILRPESIGDRFIFVDPAPCPLWIGHSGPTSLSSIEIELRDQGGVLIPTTGATVVDLVID
jgi:hypothetical protein